jgi:hypothetical protein
VERPVGISFEISQRNHGGIAARDYATVWSTRNHKLTSVDTKKKTKECFKKESDEAFKQVYISQIMRQIVREIFFI